MNRHRLLLVLTMAGALAWCSFAVAASPRELAPHVDPQLRLSDITLDRQGDHLAVVVQTEDGPSRVSPAQFLAALEARREIQQQHGFLFTLFNITNWWGVLWVGLGLLGQVLFTGRMVVQWLVSEKHQRSVVPPAFWWMSLIGASMLILYFTWRKDIVGFLGQATGWLIYVRNLWMIHRPAVPAAADAAPPAAP